MKANFCKYLVCLPAFVLALLFFNPLTARANTITFGSPYSTYNVPPLYVSAGYDVLYTVSFGSSVNDGNAVSGETYFFSMVFSPSVTYPSGNYSISLENVRLSYGGSIYYPSYVSSGLGGYHYFSFPVVYTAHSDYTLLADLHFWASETSIVSGVVVSCNMGTCIGTLFQDYSNVYDKTVNSSIQYQTALQHSDSATQLSTSQYQTALQHSDAVTALEQSQKQTSALTEFDKASVMASDSANADNTVSSYKDAESSLVSGAQDGISKFDYTSLFNFPVALTQSFMLVSTWLSALISQMGSFSLIFSIGAALSLALLFIGLWKFK